MDEPKGGAPPGGQPSTTERLRWLTTGRRGAESAMVVDAKTAAELGDREQPRNSDDFSVAFARRPLLSDPFRRQALRDALRSGRAVEGLPDPSRIDPFTARKRKAWLGQSTPAGGAAEFVG